LIKTFPIFDTVFRIQTHHCPPSDAGFFILLIIMSKELLEPYYQKYTFQCAQVRGIVLQECILMERLMDSVIADFFCKEQEMREALMDIILCTKRMTFESKTSTFREILNRRFPGNEKQNTAIYKSIINTIETRNMFAHYVVDYSNQAVVDYIQTQTTVALLKYDKKRVSEIFTRERVESIVAKIHSITKVILDLKEHPDSPPKLEQDDLDKS
jgi:hypothetical protein